MRHKRHSDKRVSRGIYYWFISKASNINGFGVYKCKESGHPFDNENFARHNYYLTDEDAKLDIEDHIAREKFRCQYIRDFNIFKALPSEKKREYRNKLLKQIKKEESQ